MNKKDKKIRKSGGDASIGRAGVDGIDQNQESVALNDDEKVAIDTMILSDVVYEGVLEQLNLGDDPIYRELVLGMLKRQTKDHLIFSIWNNLDDEQARHLRQMLNQTAVTDPWLRLDDLLIEFAMMYPSLMDKVYASLTEFFQRFIGKFNEISEA